MESPVRRDQRVKAITKDLPPWIYPPCSHADDWLNLSYHAAVPEVGAACLEHHNQVLTDIYRQRSEYLQDILDRL